MPFSTSNDNRKAGRNTSSASQSPAEQHIAHTSHDAPIKVDANVPTSVVSRSSSRSLAGSEQVNVTTTPLHFSDIHVPGIGDLSFRGASITSRGADPQTSFLFEDKSTGQWKCGAPSSITYFPHQQGADTPQKPDDFKLPGYLRELPENDDYPNDQALIQAPWGTMYILTDDSRYAGALHVLQYYQDIPRLPVTEGESWGLLSGQEERVGTLSESKHVGLTPDTRAYNQIVRSSTGAWIEFLGRGDVVLLDKNLREPFTPPRSHNIYYLTSATVATTKGLSESAERQLREFLKALASETVKIAFYAPDQTRLTSWRGNAVSAALAYTTVIGLKGGNLAFSTVIAKAPGKVQLEAATFIQGRLIDGESTIEILHTVVNDTIYRPEIVRGQEIQLAESSANFIAAVYRDWDPGENQQAIDGEANGKKLFKLLKTSLLPLMEREKTSIVRMNAATPTSLEDRRKTLAKYALVSALAIAGVLKYISNMQKENDAAKKKALFAITATLSAIGFAVPVPYVAAAGGVASVVGAAILDYFWRDPFKGLDVAIRDFILTEIYWPLGRDRKLNWDILGGFNFSSEDVADFLMFFELGMKSAHIGL